MMREVKSLQIDREVFAQTLEKKLADLPPLPTVVTRIMQTVNDPDTSAEDLNRLISLDQGLSSRMLRIVNSAYYGFPKRISTITHAVVILGFNTVRNLVLGVSAFGMLGQKGAAGGLDRTLFWRHSIASAVGASILAKKRNPKTRSALEEAFLGGLLHDIGEIFLDSYFPVPYAVAMAFAARQGVSTFEAQQKVMTIDYQTVGRKIGEHWNFPASMVATIGGHRSPVVNTEFFEHQAIAHAADYLAWISGYGSVEGLPAPELAPQVREWLGFTAADFEALQEELTKQFAAAEDMLQLAA